MPKKLTAGQRMIASAKQALAFAQGENNAGVVEIPREIATARIRRKIKMSQSQYKRDKNLVSPVGAISVGNSGRGVPPAENPDRKIAFRGGQG